MKAKDLASIQFVGDRPPGTDVVAPRAASNPTALGDPDTGAVPTRR